MMLSMFNPNRGLYGVKRRLKDDRVQRSIAVVTWYLQDRLAEHEAYMTSRSSWGMVGYDSLYCVASCLYVSMVFALRGNQPSTGTSAAAAGSFRQFTDTDSALPSSTEPSFPPFIGTTSLLTITITISTLHHRTTNIGRWKRQAANEFANTT